MRYMEVRCSPANYTRGGLSDTEVLHIMMDELCAPSPSPSKCCLRIIIIGSRHGKPEQLRLHITLAQNIMETDTPYARYLVGFDIAGNEAAKSPRELRKALEPLRRNCLRFTIHAGETEPVANIWEAVYELNADRIGHGLTLHQNTQLLKKLRDRNVCVELCPSSNDQIVGFAEEPDSLSNGSTEYPLCKYMELGLRTCNNTDNPGISQTNFSAEYYKAATLRPGRLTRWDVLILIRNSYRSSFADFDIRRNLLQQAEKELFTMLESTL